MYLLLGPSTALYLQRVCGGLDALVRQSSTDVTAIRCLRTQFIYMTATLPPSIQAEFEERNHLLRPTIIRASSNRPYIFYMVRKTDTQKESLLEQTASEVCDA